MSNSAVNCLERAVQPQVCQLFLNTISPQTLVQIFEVDEIEMLVLVKAREYEKFLAGVRVDVTLQALGADLFHHALHRAVDRADGGVVFV